MAKPVHSMLRVLDEAKSLDFYLRAFGLSVADRLVFFPVSRLCICAPHHHRLSSNSP
jgi:catechol 2,3-dioxygenase-like lactoylglutathione lyase family enzyme